MCQRHTDKMDKGRRERGRRDRGTRTTPILERFQVPEHQQSYMMTFYMNGLMAIVNEWLKRDCADPIEQICRIMEHCVMGRKC